jgi:hypothetical protein
LIKLLKSPRMLGLAGLLAVSGVSVTPATASFDGTWTVNIVTTRGICEGGSGLPILISAGKIASATTEVGVTGRVAEHGGITVTVIQGIKRAFGSGKLADTSGSGTWRGGPCSGTWTATRI